MCTACCCLGGSSIGNMICCVGIMRDMFHKHQHRVASKTGLVEEARVHAAHVCMHSGAVMGSCRMPWHMSHARHSAMPCKDLCTTSSSFACCPEGPATSAAVISQTLQCIRDHIMMAVLKAQAQCMPTGRRVQESHSQGHGCRQHYLRIMPLTVSCLRSCSSVLSFHSLHRRAREVCTAQMCPAGREHAEVLPLV